jgi:hypothetical protein
MAGTFDIKNYKLMNQVSGIALAHYTDLDLTLADFTDPGFFNAVYNQLSKGSVLITTGSDGTAMLAVASNTDRDVALVNIAGGTTEAGALTLESDIEIGDDGGTITGTLSGTTFTSEVAAETVGNYTIDAGVTGLTVTAVTYVDANSVEFTVTGTAVAGVISIIPKAAACTNGIQAVAGELSIETETPTAGTFALTSAIVVDDTGGTITGNLTGTIFASEAAAEDVDNYTIDAGTTGLTVASVSMSDDNTVVFTCTGTAVAGTISITPEADACYNGLAATAGTFEVEAGT